MRPQRYFFREEVRKACEKLDQKRAGKPIALCYSAGLGSEIIAHNLTELGIPFELYFLDIWGINKEIFEKNASIYEQKCGKKINFSYLSKEYFYTEHISKVFPWMGCDHPTYLALTYLFDQIPSDRFIVVGGGDLDRSQAIYQVIKKEYSIDAKGLNLPFSSSRMAYYLWARQNKRAGEFYFFSSTPELIASVLTDPDFILASDGSQVRSMMQKAFPEIPSRPKSTNWDNEAYRENIWVRSRVARVARELEGMHFWRSGIGTMVNMDKIFYDRE